MPFCSLGLDIENRFDGSQAEGREHTIRQWVIPMEPRMASGYERLRTVFFYS